MRKYFGALAVRCCLFFVMGSGLVSVANDDVQINSETAEKDVVSKDVDDSVSSEDVRVSESKSAEPVSKLLVAPDMRLQLDEKFNEIRDLNRVENAFSLKLYSALVDYGSLLYEAGMLDEAQETYSDALHISKVNYGIYSIEQRAALKALFDINFDLGDNQRFEEYLNRLLWIENKHPDLEQSLAYELLVRVGQFYLDQFIDRPIAGELGYRQLDKAKRAFARAINLSSDKSLSERIPPYGELALASYHEARIITKVEATVIYDDPRRRQRSALSSSSMESFIAKPFSQGRHYLNRYLEKAQDEEQVEHVVNALLSLGDFNQLFSRSSRATSYYQQAWRVAQELDEGNEVRNSLSSPVALPAFNYTLQWQAGKSSRAIQPVSLRMTVGRSGKVTQVEELSPEDERQENYIKAKRALRGIVFRPAIEEGKTVGGSEIEHTVYVRASKKKVDNG